MRTFQKNDLQFNWETIKVGFHNGTESAFKAIYDNYYLDLFYFSKKIISDQVVAEEIVSDSFMKAFKNPKNFQHNLQLKSFLFTCTKNASLDYLSSQKVRSKNILLLSHTIEEFEDTTYKGEKEVKEAELLTAIMMELKEIPPLARKVFTMRYIDNIDLKKVCEITGIGYQTAKNQTRIARAHLQQSPLLWRKMSET